jgi:hypothetical protein
MLMPLEPRNSWEMTYEMDSVAPVTPLVTMEIRLEDAARGRSYPHSLKSNYYIELLFALRVSELVCVITRDTPALSDYRPGRRGCRISL